MSEYIRPGAYDQLITQELAEQLSGLPAERVLREALESGEAPELLARHLKLVIRRALRAFSNENDPIQKIRLSNQIVASLAAITGDQRVEGDFIDVSDTPILLGILPEEPIDRNEMVSPSIRLSESALLVNGRNQPSIGHEINKELTSTDSVDLVCSFVMNTGLNILENSLQGVHNRGGRIRVLTTVYMGATQRKALDRLVNLGAEVRISYDGTTTRLHAKAWLLHRKTGATTAYIGSSNLSKAALTDGLEWNVKVSAREQQHIIDAMSAAFDDYWNDPEFELYIPERDAERLDAALSMQGMGGTSQISLSFANIDVVPRPFQQEVLDALTFERDERGKHKNLVVMATGTGKTVVAGLDFRRLSSAGKVKTLLFVAHRKEILQQSLVTFRTILRDGSFGELFVDGQRPNDWNHVFGSIQSLTAGSLDELQPDRYDMVIVDEFHHAAANSYERLLSHLRPKYLLGLTATPERSDGKPILHWFGDAISAELRLWEAIDRQILSPFQYFGIHDNTDLNAAGIKWTRGQGYDVAGLTNLYTANDARVALILEQLNRYVADLTTMKAIGFCVSIEHADYMARKFNEAGLVSLSVTSALTSDERASSLHRLRHGEVKCIFAVDIFNEGVDIPDINTIMMLRPTESATVFVQQLGRGLRKSDTKSCLTVLDFVGHQNKDFRFDMKYGSLLGLGRRQLATAIENDFPQLPSGCHFELDRVSKEHVLANLKQALKIKKSMFAQELRRLGDVPTGEFFSQTGIDLHDFYRNKSSLTQLRHEVLGGHKPTAEDLRLAGYISRLLHVDDYERISFYKSVLTDSGLDPSDKRTQMFAQALFQADVNQLNLKERLEVLRKSLAAREIADVLQLLVDKRTRSVIHLSDSRIPLNVHSRYSRAELLAAFGLTYTGAEVSGVRYAKEMKADLAFVTLNKTETHFSASTMYADTAISSTIFQWESQSTTSESSETGQRYINHQDLGITFHLFVRDWKVDPETQMTMPFMYFGPASYMSHEGSRPMRIRWQLSHEIPADVLVRSKVIAS